MTALLSKTIKTEKTEKEFPDWINTLTYLYKCCNCNHIWTNK